MADIELETPENKKEAIPELSPVAKEGIQKLKKELRDLTPEQKRIKTEELIKSSAEGDRLPILKELRRSELFAMKESKDPKMKKVVEILKNRESFEDMNVADVLALRNTGIPLYSYLLIQKKESHKEITAEDLKEGAEFEVNFGKNPSMKSSVGAGDILPVDVYEVEINGRRGVRAYDERPGYYEKDARTGKMKYIPVYDGDSIRIISKKTPSPKEMSDAQDAQDEHYMDKLIEVYTDAKRSGKNPREVLSYLSDEEFKDIEAQVVENEKYDAARRKLEPDANNREDFIRFYGRSLNAACEEFGIPPEVMLHIYEKESGFRMVKNKDGSAFGIGQIIDSTWNEIQNKMVGGRRLDRNSIEDNILASVALLANNRKYRNGDLFEALGDYVTGPGSAKTINEKGLWNSMVTQNGGIAKAAGISLSSDPVATNENLARFREASVQYHFGFTRDELSKLSYSPLVVPEYISDLKPTDIPSAPAIKINGMTYCSRTAKINGERFGLNLPRGDALDVGRGFTENHTNLFTESGTSNFADIVLTSSGTNGSRFGHRVVGFKGIDEEWYILDPYRNANPAVRAVEYLHNYTHGKVFNIAFHTVNTQNISSIRLAKLIAPAA